LHGTLPVTTLASVDKGWLAVSTSSGTPEANTVEQPSTWTLSSAMLRRQHHIIISSRQGLLLPALLLTVTVGALVGSSPGTQTGEVGPKVKTPPPAPVQNPLLSDTGTVKDRVADFYKLCLPSKVDKLDKIFFRYGARGGHNQLLSDLREK
jgi:hypothetical protein